MFRYPILKTNNTTYSQPGSIRVLIYPCYYTRCLQDFSNRIAGHLRTFKDTLGPGPKGHVEGGKGGKDDGR